MALQSTDCSRRSNTNPLLDSIGTRRARGTQTFVQTKHPYTYKIPTGRRHTRNTQTNMKTKYSHTK